MCGHVASSCKRRSVYRELWLHPVSTNGRELLVFGKMGSRYHQLQRFWQENLPATRQRVHKFLKKYKECGTIDRREGTEKMKRNAEIRGLVDEKMMADDETTAKELKKMLSEHGHQICERTALKCLTQLGWTRRGSAYCQVIRDVNKVK